MVRSVRSIVAVLFAAACASEAKKQPDDGSAPPVLCAVPCLATMVEACVPAGLCDGKTPEESEQCLAGVLSKERVSLDGSGRHELRVRKGDQACFTADVQSGIGNYEIYFRDATGKEVAMGRWSAPYTVSCVLGPSPTGGAQLSMPYPAEACEGLYRFLGISVRLR